MVAVRLLVVRRLLLGAADLAHHLRRVEEVRNAVVRRCLHGACEAMGGLSVRPRTDVGWGPCNSTPSPDSDHCRRGFSSCAAAWRRLPWVCYQKKKLDG